MAFDAGDDRLAVDAVVLGGVVRVIEGDLAPLLVDAVRVQLDLRRLLFAFLGYLVLRSRTERRVAKQSDHDKTQDRNQDSCRLHSFFFLSAFAILRMCSKACQTGLVRCR